MKRTKRVLALLASAMVVCSATAFSACDLLSSGNDDVNDGDEQNVAIEVSKDELKDLLTIDKDTYDNVTVISEVALTDSAGVLVSAERSRRVDECDFLNQKFYMVGESVIYEPENPDAVDGYVTQNCTRYAFCYNKSYYVWQTDTVQGSSEPYIIELFSVDEATNGFIQATVTYIFKTFANSDEVTYNSQTKAYESYIDENFVSVLFFKNGDIKVVTQIENASWEITLTKINSTTVTIPEYVYSDLNAYLAEKAN